MSKKIEIYFNDLDALTACEYILIKKKIIKNNFYKNDKTQPFYVIIDTNIDKKILSKILNQFIKHYYIMR